MPTNDFDFADEFGYFFPMRVDELPEDVPETSCPEVIYYADAEGYIDSLEREYGEQADDICSGREFAASEWNEARLYYANALLYVAHYDECYQAWGEFLQQADDFSKVIDNWCTSYGYENRGIVLDTSPDFDVSLSRLESDDCGNLYIRGNPEDSDCTESLICHQLECGIWATATLERVAAEAA